MADQQEAFTPPFAEPSQEPPQENPQVQTDQPFDNQTNQFADPSATTSLPETAPVSTLEQDPTHQSVVPDPNQQVGFGQSPEPIATHLAPPNEQQTTEEQQPLPGQQLPTEVDAYKPLEVQAQIAEITPAKFDNLTKVLDILVKNKPDRIVIRGSKINETVQGSVITADVEKILGTDINFEITDPKKHVDLFKSFKGNNNIFILDDPENTRYIMTNGPIKIFLPKQVDQLVAETNPPDLSNAEGLCFREIPKEIKDDIKSLGKHSDSIEYLIHDNEVKAMHIPDTGIYRFEEFIKDPNIAKLDETNAQLVLKSEFFLPVDADMYRIDIVKNAEGSLISVTQCNAGMVKIAIFEQLEDTTGGNIQF